MAIYLLDTNAISELVRHPSGPVSVTYRLKENDPESKVLTSIIVACEVRYGIAKNHSVWLEQRANEVLERVVPAAMTDGADEEYAAVRADLERRGQVIGQNDMLIAAHALALNAILVTDNTSEFKRVKGLRVENWLRARR
jgi:tRNA(fMet)-specific endonuclease VapC